MSNCLDFRRAKLAAPRAVAPSAVAHRNTCRRCAQFDRLVNELDRKLEEMALISVPHGLEERILLRHWFRNTGRPGLLAWAAAALHSGAKVLLFARESARQAFARRMIAHVLSCPPIAMPDREIPDTRVVDAFLTVGGTLCCKIGRVSFLDRCQGLDPGGTHLVMDTPYGRAVVLLLPNAGSWPRATIEDQGCVAAVLPVRRGVVAVVADSALQATRIRNLLCQAIDWRG